MMFVCQLFGPKQTMVGTFKSGLVHEHYKINKASSQDRNLGERQLGELG